MSGDVFLFLFTLLVSHDICVSSESRLVSFFFFLSSTARIVTRGNWQRCRIKRLSAVQI